YQSHLPREHRLRPVGTHRDHFHRLANELGDSVEVAAGVRWHCGELADAGDVHVPAGKRFVDRLHAAKVVDVAGKAVGPLTVQLVFGADLHLRQVAENVHHHHGDAVDAGEPGGIADGNRVEPAAAAGAASGRPIFAADLADFLAGRIVLLG